MQVNKCLKYSHSQKMKKCSMQQRSKYLNRESFPLVNPENGNQVKLLLPI